MATFWNSRNVNWSLENNDSGFSPRDSAAHAYFNELFWVIGGWSSSEPSVVLQDIWSSSDGKRWRLESPLPSKHGDLATAIVFKNKLFLFEGAAIGTVSGPLALSNSVWSTSNGRDWELVIEHAEFSPRVGAAIATLNGRLWLFGGVTSKDGRLVPVNDVWSSDDGKNWSLMTGDSDWSPRAYHQVQIFKGKFWLLGGGMYWPGVAQPNDVEASNEVWYSSDGIHWTKEQSPPWEGRVWFSAVVYQNHLWILGGRRRTESDREKNLNDVWFSPNGKDWFELPGCVPWQARHAHFAYVAHDKIYIAGGNAKPLKNDVWSIRLDPSKLDRHGDKYNLFCPIVRMSKNVFSRILCDASLLWSGNRCTQH